MHPLPHSDSGLVVVCLRFCGFCLFGWLVGFLLLLREEEEWKSVLNFKNLSLESDYF